VAAEPGRLNEIRHRLTSWAETANLPPEQIEAVTLASYEALANVVDHAYEKPPRRWRDLCLEAEIESDTIVVTISDHGHWLPPATDPGARGHGLMLMGKLSNSLSINKTDGGTVVRLCWERESQSGS
jgi:serine/threonine-protein kinase RsbW